MNRILLVMCLGLASCGTTSTKPSEPASTPLFDGTSLTGWVQRGGSASYRVEDGAIVGETRPRQPNSFLCTEATYRDFEMSLEFMVDDSLNSGVQIRSAARPEGKLERVYGYQIEIDPSERAWTGGLYEEGARGWLQDLKTNDVARRAFKHGEWNTMRVRCEGDRIMTWINDVPCVDVRDSGAAAGFIALQVHGVSEKTEPMRVRWRKIELRELDR